MNFCAGSLLKTPAFQAGEGGSHPTPALHSPRDLVIRPAPLTEIRSFVETYHYSHSVNGVKVSHCFRVDAKGELVGALIFGAMSTTAWKKFSDCEKSVLELRRLVLLDAAGKNCESRVLGVALRWLRKSVPGVRLIVSYADPAHGHRGGIYRAANFTDLGTSAPDIGFRDPDSGKVYHSRALRTRYRGTYKPFVVRLRQKLSEGRLERVSLPGKHCFIFKLR